MAPCHHSLNRVRRTFENRLDAAIAPVADEPRYPERPGFAGAAIPKEHPLDPTLDLHPPADRRHPPIMPVRSSSGDAVAVTFSHRFPRSIRRSREVAVHQPTWSLAEMRARVAYAGSPLYLGAGTQGPAFASPQHGVLVLGPPRAGKTTSLVIPNVLLAPGAVVSTSTKADVLAATYAERSAMGRCWLFDPAGTTPAPPGTRQLRWSPVPACQNWDTAVRTARAMTSAARPSGYLGESAHWTERAEALLAPLMHAAAVFDSGIDQVVRWVNRHDIDTPLAALELGGNELAVDILTGLSETDPRELSGIWSTTSGVLAAYRSEHALALAQEPNFDPHALPTSRDAVYICASGRDQALTAPLVVGLIEQIRAAAYETTASAAHTGRWPGPPIALILDETANIAPLPELPAIVSEGGSQGLVTLACFQDLSQARARWGMAADGFPTLFGAKVVLGGIRDIRTLDMISRLAGDGEVPHNSVTRRSWPIGRQHPSVTLSTRRQPRLPVDVIAHLPAGESLLIDGPRPPTFLSLTPWFRTAPFAEAQHTLALPPPNGRDRIARLGWSL
ncbi:MAG: type secretion system protein VirD4 [Acidimicrobiaceae bacterium]|nr:type secretion system protein VirD4 [Acidimicrobiaceae bacterium]